MTPSHERPRIPPAPPRPCPDIAVEAWDPSLDPCAISREATEPSPWSAGSLAALLTLALGTTAVLVPWRQPRTAQSGLSPGSRSTIALALREVLPVQPGDHGSLHAPGGGAGRPQWAPVATPGIGGMGDLQAIPSVNTSAPRGELSSPAVGLSPTTALGGGLTPRLGVGGGSPSGRTGGIGGGARGGTAGTAGPDLPFSAVPVPWLVPIHKVKPVFTERTSAAGRRIVVVVRVLIAMDGSVQSASYVGGEASAREAAVAAALAWRFKPLALCGFSAPTSVNIQFDTDHRDG